MAEEKVIKEGKMKRLSPHEAIFLLFGAAFGGVLAIGALIALVKFIVKLIF